jgi:hypothetical protein
MCCKDCTKTNERERHREAGEEMNEYYNKRYERRKASGKCVICGGEKENKDVLCCNYCAERQKARQKQSRAERETQEKIRLLNIIREMVGYEG